MDYTKATRDNYIESVEIIHVKKGDPLYPAGIFLRIEPPDEVWFALTTIKSGLLSRMVFTDLCLSESEARESKAKEGTAIVDAPNPDFQNRRVVPERLISEGLRNFILVNVGDENSSLAYDILQAAGLKKCGGVTDLVANAIGDDTLRELRDAFGENWVPAALFAYGERFLPTSSAASLAIAYQFHHYLSGNDFLAGYCWRDMELAASGAEKIAVREISRGAKAGAIGKVSSQQARLKRRLQLFEAMEALCARNPDFAVFDPLQVANAALRKLVTTHPKLWGEGKGQIEQYLAEIKVGDAGDDIKTRYLALFPTKPPERF